MRITSPNLVAAVAGILIVVTPFSSIPIAQARQAPNCGQIVDSFNRETNAFVAQADQQNIGFIHEEIFKDSMQDFNAIKAKWDALQEAREQLNTAYTCLLGGGGCVKTIREQLKGKIQEWFDGVTDSAGLTAVRDRVLAARNLIDGYTNRALQISTDTMGAMKECTSAMPGQPKPDLNTVPTAVSTTAEGLPEVKEPPSKPVDSGGGMGGTLALVAAVGGGLYGAQALGLFGSKCAADAPNNYHSTCESQGRSTSSCIALQSEYQTWCDCQGRSFSYTGGCTGSK